MYLALKLAVSITYSKLYAIIHRIIEVLMFFCMLIKELINQLMHSNFNINQFKNINYIFEKYTKNAHSYLMLPYISCKNSTTQQGSIIITVLSVIN